MYRGHFKIICRDEQKKFDNADFIQHIGGVIIQTIKLCWPINVMVWQGNESER